MWCIQNSRNHSVELTTFYLWNFTEPVLRENWNYNNRICKVVSSGFEFELQHQLIFQLRVDCAGVAFYHLSYSMSCELSNTNVSLYISLAVCWWCNVFFSTTIIGQLISMRRRKSLFESRQKLANFSQATRRIELPIWWFNVADKSKIWTKDTANCLFRSKTLV